LRSTDLENRYLAMLSQSRSSRWLIGSACLGIILLLAWHRDNESARTESAVPAAGRIHEPIAGDVIVADHSGSEAAATLAADAPAHPPEKPAAFSTGRDLPMDFLERIVSGKKVAFILPDGTEARGGIEMMERDAHGILFVQGRLTLPEPGFYFFQRQTTPGVAGPFVGHVRFDGKEDAWKIEPTGNLGDARLNARKLDEILCVSYVQGPEEAADDAPEQAPQTHPSSIPSVSYQTVIPLESLPGATAVIYLDFDGEQGPFPSWGDFYAAPANASNAQIYDVWKMVSEDFQGFNINVTTDRRVFDTAPDGRRTHCIITPTTTASPGAGGAAYVGSFNWSGDRICWAFYATGKNACEVISHEVGHTLGLSHDGRTSPNEAYYAGHGTDPVGWAPIMGVGYSKKLTQWSKGEYLGANQTQDDLAIITTKNNDVDYRADDTGDVLDSARYLEIAADNSVTNEGIIETTGDVDSFRFATTGGPATLHVKTVTLNPNLDLLAEIVDPLTGTVLTSANPDLDINASVTATLPAGEYLLRVRGTGRGDPLGNGYTDYGCIGSYLISGSVTGGIKPERFQIAENSAAGSPVGTIIPRNAHPPGTTAYAITGGNPDSAFAIDPNSGTVTVANRNALDFERLSTRWDDPATIEFFVTITNAADPALTEILRTVVTVTNVNEAPTVAVETIKILEHTAIGSRISTVDFIDPDRFDRATFSITGGNSGGLFSIDPTTGDVTVAADISVPQNTAINLTIQAADQGTPPLTATADLAITVIHIAGDYQPGRIARTYFENIPGNTVASLTGNLRFPNKPDSEEFLTSLDAASHGDNFGSTIRGYLIPPATGSYRFWLASDDASDLRIGSNASPASATVRASASGWMERYAWTNNPAQQSAAINLVEGQPYYIEVRHKESTASDHVAVAWSGPGIMRQVISGLFLAPFYQNYAPTIPPQTFTIRENAVAGQTLGTVAASDVNTGDSPGGFAITGGNTGGVFGIDPASGQLYLAAGGLLDPAVKATYSLTVETTDRGSPALKGSGTVTVNVIRSSDIRISGIVQEIWTGIGGTTLTGLTSSAAYPYQASVRRVLTAFDSGTAYGDHYGSRIRARFIPPQSGDYRFHLAGDDDCRLLFSTAEDGSNAAEIASVSGSSGPKEWTKFPSQTSAIHTLVAGQAVYLEALHKEGSGSDHLSIGYTHSDSPEVTVIPGALLQPFNINAAPAFSNSSYSFNLVATGATAGMEIGRVVATDPNGETITYAILNGNAAEAFSIHPSTGSITVANPAALANGAVKLQIAAQDRGLAGDYPLASATAEVTIQVTGLNTEPLFVANPLAKSDATAGFSYAGTIADSAVDGDNGDTLKFSKISGPDWLEISETGELLGTPSDHHVGMNEFIVRATDSGALFADATLQILTLAANPDANGNGIPDQWEIEQIGRIDPPGGNPAVADADGDGLSNLMEFALGTNPVAANPNPLTLTLATHGDDTFLQLTVPRNPDAPGLVFSVEVSSDPASETWSATPTVVVSETPSELTVRDSQPVRASNRRFMRLKVTSQP
jgi:hypothetical protein